MSSAKRHHLAVGLYVKDTLDHLLAGKTDSSKLVLDLRKRENPHGIRVFREEEARYKSDRKKLDRARRIVTAKRKKP